MHYIDPRVVDMNGLNPNRDKRYGGIYEDFGFFEKRMGYSRITGNR